MSEQEEKFRAEIDAFILGIYEGIEGGEPDISTERLLEMTATVAKCEVDRVVEALRRESEDAEKAKAK